MIGKHDVHTGSAMAPMRARHRPLAAAVAIALLMGMGAPVARAAASHWKGTVSTDWTDAANWDVAPAIGSDVIIDTTSPHDSLLNRPGMQIDQLTVGQQAKGALTLSGGGTLAVHGSDTYGSGVVLGDAAGSEGDLTVTGAGSTLTVDQGAQIGKGGRGVLAVTSGGTVNLALAPDYEEVLVGFGYYGQLPDSASGSGSITVDGTGSTLNYAGGLNLLNGSVTVSDGGTLDSQSRGDGGWLDVIGFGRLANDPDSDVIRDYAVDGQGTATITGAGSSWQSVNQLIVGDGGDGALSVLDGGSASFTGRASIGVAVTSYDYVRDPGTGKVTSTAVGSKAGNGTVEVSGQDSSLRITASPASLGLGNGDLIVGDSSAGTLSVGDKGGVDVAGMLTVGNQAQGTLTIAGGGTLAVHGSDANSMGAFLGNAAGSQGDATVSGSGSLLSVDQGLRVGYGGSGSMSIEQGGEVKVGGDLFAGDVVGGQVGQGIIDVKGSGSVLDVEGDRLEIDAGSLAVSDGAYVSAGGGGLVVRANGLLDIAGGGTVTATTFYHVGSSLAVTGDGSSLSAGGWEFSDAGTVTVSDGGRISSEHPVDIQGEVLIGGVDSNGTVRAPGVVDFPQLVFQGTSTTLTFQHSGSVSDEYDFAVAMASGDYDSASLAGQTGYGHIAVEAGFTRLTGDSSRFVGSTAVDSGATLSVNGSLGGDIAVEPGGRLQGTGTVDNATIGGTLAPGNSPGTLHVAGDLVMQTGSVYEAQIDPATGQSDSVAVAGNVTIEPGATLEIQNLGSQPLMPGDQIDLIQSTGQGTVQGQFDNTEGAITDFMGYGVTYDNGNVVLGVTRSSTSFASAGDTPQSHAVGTALDGVAVDSSLGMLLFSQLTTVDQAAAAFSGMSGTVHADIRRTLLDDSRLVRDAVDPRMQWADGSERTSWWIHALGTWGSTDGSVGLGDARTDSSGTVIGFDTRVGAASRLGVAAGLGQTSWRMDGQGSAHVKSRHLAFYGTSAAGRLDLGYGLAFSWNDIGTNRRFKVGSAPQQLNSDSHARTDQVFAEAGYRIGDDRHRYAEPYVMLAHARVHGDAVHERGSVTALDVSSGTDSATFGSLGLRWSAGTEAIHWYGTLGWRHVFGFDRPTVQARFEQGGGTFAVQGLPMAKDAAQIALGARFAIGKRTHVSLGYQGLIASSSRDNGASARLVVDF